MPVRPGGVNQSPCAVVSCGVLDLIVALVGLALVVTRLAVYFREREDRRRAEGVAHDDAIRIARAVKLADRDGTREIHPDEPTDGARKDE